jgi:hypothetical protein
MSKRLPPKSAAPSRIRRAERRAVRAAKSAWLSGV